MRNPKNAFSRPHNIVISEKIAHIYFSNQDCLFLLLCDKILPKMKEARRRKSCNTPAAFQ